MKKVEERIDYQILWVKGLNSLNKKKPISFATSSLTLWASVTMGNTFFSFSVFSIYMALQSSLMCVICSFDFCPIAAVSNKWPPLPPQSSSLLPMSALFFSEILNKEVYYVGSQSFLSNINFFFRMSLLNTCALKGKLRNWMKSCHK